MDEARTFIANIRQLHALSGKNLRGVFGLSDEQDRAVRASASQLVTEEFNNASLHEALTKLLLKFEEMCRRNSRLIPDRLRLEIARHLFSDLSENITVFRCEKAPLKVTQLTIYHGTSCVALHEEREFAEFRKTPGIFRQAATNHSTDPRGFLRRVQANVAALMEDMEFAEFREMPSIFYQAAANNSTDPQGFLRRVQVNIAALMEDEEFAEFRETPGIFRRAAVHYSTNPQGFLRRVQGGEVIAGKDEYMQAPPFVFG